MKLHLTSLAALYSNKLAQISIGHVAYAGFVIGSTFMTGISAYYLLKKETVFLQEDQFI